MSNKTPFTGIKHLCKYNINDDVKNKPKACVQYPFEKRIDPKLNVCSPRHRDCQYYNEEKKNFYTHDELVNLKGESSVIDYCVSCGICCYILTDRLDDFGIPKFAFKKIDWTKFFVDRDHYLENTNKCSALVLKNEKGEIVIDKPDPYVRYLYE